MNADLITSRGVYQLSKMNTVQENIQVHQDLLQAVDDVHDWSSDPIDVAQRLCDIYTREALRAFVVVVQQKRDHARERLLKGYGGICEDCGQMIPVERMEASNWEATRCIDCQRYNDNICR